MNVTGTFRDAFDLHRFPFDTQNLTIVVSSNHPQPSFTSPSTGPLVSLCHDPCTMTARGDSSQNSEFVVATQPLISIDPSHTKFAILDVEINATRNYLFYVCKIMLPTFFITTMGSAVVVVPRNNVADRMSITLTLVLTSVAFNLT